MSLRLCYKDGCESGMTRVNLKSEPAKPSSLIVASGFSIQHPNLAEQNTSPYACRRFPSKPFIATPSKF